MGTMRGANAMWYNLRKVIALSYFLLAAFLAPEQGEPVPSHTLNDTAALCAYLQSGATNRQNFLLTGTIISMDKSLDDRPYIVIQDDSGCAAMYCDSENEPQVGDYVTANKGRDMAKYREYVKNQVTELLTNYGPIDILWFDFSYPMVGGKCRDDWDSVGLVKLVRKLAPNIIIDNRLDLPDYEDGWDFATPEQNREPFWVKVNGRKVPWETCQTFSGSWGYARDEKGWKSSFQVIEQLISTVSKGGNVIMNVGPTAAGEFDYRAMERLADYGKWLHACGDSIYGCTAAPEEFVAPNGTILTYNPKTNKLYMHMLSWQWGEFAVPFMGRVKFVQLLNDKSEIRVLGGKLQLPTDKPPVEIPVIEFTLK